MNTAFEKLCLIVREKFEHHPGCHDWSHTWRVVKNARILALTEGGNCDIINFSALLHDIGRLEELTQKGACCHATLGAKQVPEMLAIVKIIDPKFVEAVQHCVAAHRYRRRENGIEPVSIEAKIVYDADKLDSLGAVGIGRAFHFAGRINAKLHNNASIAMLSESYSREDSAYREFLVKLRHLHQNMLTQEGQRQAKQRHSFMIDFFTKMNVECAQPEDNSNWH